MRKAPFFIFVIHSLSLSHSMDKITHTKQYFHFHIHHLLMVKIGFHGWSRWKMHHPSTLWYTPQPCFFFFLSGRGNELLYNTSTTQSVTIFGFNSSKEYPLSFEFTLWYWIVWSIYKIQQFREMINVQEMPKCNECVEANLLQNNVTTTTQTEKRTA